MLRREDPDRGAREAVRATARGIPGAEPVLLRGPGGAAVCAWAEGAGVDLIVAGAGCPDPACTQSSGLVHHLAAHAPCAVLVARSPGRPAPHPAAPIDIAVASSPR